jgi:hypothetical protein
MKIHGNMTPIGALDYRRPRRNEYLKEGKICNLRGFVGWFSEG